MQLQILARQLLPIISTGIIIYEKKNFRLQSESHDL